jgi:hypothetical protein
LRDQLAGNNSATSFHRLFSTQTAAMQIFLTGSSI